jgi:hypothetical protein
VKVELRDTGDLKAVVRALRQQADGKQLRRELGQGLREILRPFVPKVQAAYRAAPSKGRRKSRSRARLPDLRQLLAKATRVEVRTSGKLAGARIRVDGRKMPSGFRALPHYHEGTRPRWRHPTFGDREVWVGQESHPTFYRTVQPNETAARAEVERVVGRIFEKIERAR